MIIIIIIIVLSLLVIGIDDNDNNIRLGTIVRKGRDAEVAHPSVVSGQVLLPFKSR